MPDPAIPKPVEIDLFQHKRPPNGPRFQLLLARAQRRYLAGQWLGTSDPARHEQLLDSSAQMGAWVLVREPQRSTIRLGTVGPTRMLERLAGRGRALDGVVLSS